MVVFLYLIPGDAKHLFMCLSICIYPSQYLFNLLILSSLPILTKMEQALTEVGGGGGAIVLKRRRGRQEQGAQL